MIANISIISSWYVRFICGGSDRTPCARQKNLTIPNSIVSSSQLNYSFGLVLLKTKPNNILEIKQNVTSSSTLVDWSCALAFHPVVARKIKMYERAEWKTCSCLNKPWTFCWRDKLRTKSAYTPVICNVDSGLFRFFSSLLSPSHKNHPRCHTRVHSGQI